MAGVINRLLLLCKLLSLQLNSILFVVSTCPKASSHLLVLLSSEDHFSKRLFVSIHIQLYPSEKEEESCPKPSKWSNSQVEEHSNSAKHFRVAFELGYNSIREMLLSVMGEEAKAKPADDEDEERDDRAKGGEMPTEGLLVQPSTSLHSHTLAYPHTHICIK